ncbi:uncharacterized protein V1510DRAFT_413276 [Dipodascopsis tothii]|uniref:uncharacterized protein n=1 Tax=Dipodascopsis tothii TaxID=44089 RepID=UPI0034CF1B2B
MPLDRTFFRPRSPVRRQPSARLTVQTMWASRRRAPEPPAEANGPAVLPASPLTLPPLDVLDFAPPIDPAQIFSDVHSLYGDAWPTADAVDAAGRAPHGAGPPSPLSASPATCGPSPFSPRSPAESAITTYSDTDGKWPTEKAAPSTGPVVVATTTAPAATAVAAATDTGAAEKMVAVAVATDIAADDVSSTSPSDLPSDTCQVPSDTLPGPSAESDELPDVTALPEHTPTATDWLGPTPVLADVVADAEVKADFSRALDEIPHPPGSDCNYCQQQAEKTYFKAREREIFESLLASIEDENGATSSKAVESIVAMAAEIASNLYRDQVSAHTHGLWNDYRLERSPSCDDLQTPPPALPPRLAARRSPSVVSLVQFPSAIVQLPPPTIHGRANSRSWKTLWAPADSRAWTDSWKAAVGLRARTPLAGIGVAA